MSRVGFLPGFIRGLRAFKVENLDLACHEVWSQMCVAERHADRGVPENLLERQEISSLDHEVACEGVLLISISILKVIPTSEFQPKIVLFFSKFTAAFSKQDRNFHPELKISNGTIE